MSQGKRRKKQQGRSWRDEDTFVVVGLELEEFIPVPKLLLLRSDLSVGAKLVYIMILGYRLQDEGPGRERVFPGTDTLAAELGMNQCSVERHLRELADADLIIEK